MAGTNSDGKLAILQKRSRQELLNYLCPILSLFRPYGFKFELEVSREAEENGKIRSWPRAIYRSLIFVPFIYIAYFFYKYWRVSYKVNNQTGICYSTVVVAILVTTGAAFFTLCINEGHIGRFILSVVDLAQAQLIPEDNKQFLINTRKYGVKLTVMPTIVSIIKLTEGFYETAIQVGFVNDVLHGTFKNNATAMANLGRVIEVDYLDDPTMVAVFGSIRVIFFNGICEHFAMLFMALVAHCSYIISFSFPTQHIPQPRTGDDGPDNFPLPGNDIDQKSLAKSTDKMLLFQKQHNNITDLIKGGDDIYAPMFFLWMIFLMTGICFSVRGLKNNLTEARNTTVIFLILLHFGVFLALISVVGNLNSKVKSTLSTFPGSMDTELGAAMYIKQTQAAVESTVLYINNFFSQPIGITVWGFFIIEPDLAFSLIGTVFSYSVVMYCLKG